MRTFKPERAFYIPEGATELRDTESTAVAFLHTPAHGKPVALMFSGKRQKPDSNYRYVSEERRAQAIEEHFASVRRCEAYRAEQRETVKAARRADADLTNLKGRDYLSAPAVAGFLRQCLKEAFPGQKFSIRSGGSLRVSWTDGPSRADVEHIAKTFEGSYFDGMIDYKGSIHHSIDGQRVRFLSDFVSCSREMTREALEIGAAALAQAWAQSTNQAPCEFVEHESKWSTWLEVKANPLFPGSCVDWPHAGDVGLIGPDDGDSTRSARMQRPEFALELWFDSVRPVAPQESATFQRVQVLGSDGYGNTALEAADGGETGRGYPKQKENPEAPAMRAAIEQAAADFVAAHPEFAQFVKPQEPPAPKPVDCEVIDFLPHLHARANAARRVN